MILLIYVLVFSQCEVRKQASIHCLDATRISHFAHGGGRLQLVADEPSRRCLPLPATGSGCLTTRLTTKVSLTTRVVTAATRPAIHGRSASQATLVDKPLRARKSSTKSGSRRQSITTSPLHHFTTSPRHQTAAGLYSKLARSVNVRSRFIDSENPLVRIHPKRSHGHNDSAHRVRVALL